jgi:hypothetical protein
MRIEFPIFVYLEPLHCLTHSLLLIFVFCVLEAEQHGQSRRQTRGVIISFGSIYRKTVDHWVWLKEFLSRVWVIFCLLRLFGGVLYKLQEESVEDTHPHHLNKGAPNSSDTSILESIHGDVSLRRHTYLF